MTTPQQPSAAPAPPTAPAEQSSPPPAALRPVPDAWLRFWSAVWTGLAVAWTGSGHISDRLADWIRHGPLLRLFGLVLVAGFVYGIPYTWRILGICALAWLALAVLLGRRPRAADGDTDEQPAAEPKRTAADLTRDEVVTALHGLLGPSGGVHLKALGVALGKALGGGPVPTGEVRALLTLHGIRHRAGVRVPDAGGREGVHRDDVPPLPSPEPEPAPETVVVPGQSSNNNSNNATDGSPSVAEIGQGGYSVRAAVRPRA